MKYLLKSTAVVLGFGLSVWAASVFGQSIRGGEIAFDVDESSFMASSGYAFLEVYFAVPRENLQHPKGIQFYEANVEMAASLLKGDSLLAEKKRQNADRAAALTDIKPGQQLYNLFSFYVKPGTYKLRTRVTDLGTNTGGWLEKSIEIPDFPETVVGLSDIQLSMEIASDTSKNIFVKNGYRILPNPNKIYGIEIPLLYYYSEIYNLSPLESGRDSTYSVGVSVLDMKGDTVKSLPDKMKKRLARSLVEVGMVNVVELNSGPYQLQISVKDNGNGSTVLRRKSLFVYRRMDFTNKNVEPQPSKANFTDEFSGMEEKELDALFKQCEYIATDKEKKLYKKLDVVGKRKFMQEFWNTRDDNPLTGTNEFKQSYLERIRYVELNYKYGKKPGWKTDQGRIYLMYGPPDEVQRFPSNMGLNPYEVWQYFQIEGGATCFFVDIQNLGELRLVHSTFRRELQDEEWQRWLTPHGDYNSSQSSQ